ncbi:MAG: SufS family cysteine desulfurase [Erysipelotrichaceae bacterium]
MFDVKQIRKDFPMLNNKGINGHPLVYFDNAATTFKPQVVIDAVVNYYTNLSVNANRGDYELSYQVSKEYEDARKTVGKLLNCDSKSIVFTSGASMSLNLVAYGYGQKFLNQNDVILSTEAEHASNILPWFKVSEKTKAIIEYIPLDEDGKITIDNFKKAMHERVKVVCFANITNVMGFVAPMDEMIKIAHEYGAIVVVDGAQSVPHMPIDVIKSDIDFLAFSGHKMMGPTGVGVLYGKYELLEKMDPFMMGGGSNARFDICGNILLKHPPYKFEAGTPAIEAVLGFKAAIEYLMQYSMQDIFDYEHNLRQYLLAEMKKMDNIIIYNEHASTGIITFNVKDIFAQDVACYLSTQGVCVRSGNHCAKILMNVLKTSETLRASIAFYNTKEEVDLFIEALKKVNIENCINTIL